MGMGLAYIAGGMLQGVGQGLTQAGQITASQRWEQWKIKQAAVTKEAEDARAFKNADALNENSQIRQAERERLNDERTVAGQTQVKTLENQGRITLEQVEQSNRVALEGVKHGNNLTEIQAKTAAELNAELSKAGVIVDHYDVTTDGQLVAFNKKGDAIKHSQPGLYNPTRQPRPPEDDPYSTSDDDAAAAPMPKPRLRGTLTPKSGIAETGKASDSELFRTRWANATPENAPGLFRSGVKLSFEEAYRLYKGQ